MKYNPAALQFSDAELLGKVVAVDTSRVSIDVGNSVLLTRIGIGNLIAIRGSTEREYLVAITERVTRTIRDELPEELPEDDDEIMLASIPTDLVRAALIGTFRTVDGEMKNTFKRGADSFPQIDRDCYVVDAGNLQRFMGILGAEFPENERLKLGAFVADRTAEAIISGDKFFQRHAAILGSTGSGKSYAVALILERAAKLKYPNILVFDMHGEYAPLANHEKNGFATRVRIAGPGDLENPSEEALFLPYWLLNRDEMLSMILDRSDQNAPNQASRFTSHVKGLKQKTLEKENKIDVAKTFTVDSPIPYSIKDLLSLLERIAKEGRKYGFSLLVVSQRPSDVSKTILSQCNNFLSLRLTNDTDQAVIKRLMPDSLAGLTSVLPLLDTGEALMLGDAVLLPSRIKLDKPTIAPDSATRDFWREWGTQAPDSDALNNAVEALRSQTRSKFA